MTDKSYMVDIYAWKEKHRKELARLPFEKKIDIWGQLQARRREVKSKINPEEIAILRKKATK